MNFVRHSNLEGLHATFSPSQSSWLRYDDDTAIEVYTNKKAAEIGTRLHAWAKETIDLGIKQPRSKRALYAYVNDAIGFKMDTEVVLYYSPYFFGTADAISFRDNFLRIHDLKTGKKGKIESHLEQLEIYAALFCLEYKIKPNEIGMELRVYKDDCVDGFRPPLRHEPDPQDILDIMDKIVHLNKLLERIDYKED